MKHTQNEFTIKLDRTDARRRRPTTTPEGDYSRLKVLWYTVLTCNHLACAITLVVSARSVGVSSWRSKVQKGFAIPRGRRRGEGSKERRVRVRGCIPERSGAREGGLSIVVRLEVAHGCKRGKLGYIRVGCYDDLLG